MFGFICGIVVIILVICIIGNLQNSDIKVQTNLIQQTKESIEPYVAMVGTITENRNTEVSDSFIYNLDKVKICLLYTSIFLMIINIWEEK